MSILDWFDIDNVDHVRAWKVLNTTGRWPAGFLPGDITFPTLWHGSISARFAERFVDEFLARHPTESGKGGA